MTSSTLHADVVDLAVGAPEFETPEPVRRAAIAAISAGHTTYTDAAGIEELRRAIGTKLARDNGLDYGLDQICVGSGAKQLMFSLFLATVAPGDEVVIGAPHYAAYPRLVELARGVPVVRLGDPDDGYRLTPAILAEALSERTGWVVLNSPANPTGTIYSDQQLRALCELILERAPRARILSDELYESFRFDGSTPIGPAGLSPAVRARTVTVNGVSKAHGMTGWRIGYAAGDAEVIARLAAMQLATITCASSISQWAAVAALAGDPADISARVATLADRRQLVASKLDALPGVRCPVPDGGIYAFPDCRGLLGSSAPDGSVVADDAYLVTYLANAGVRVAAGRAFGLGGHLRVTFAVAEATLAEGLRRLREAVGALAPPHSRHPGTEPDEF